MDENGRRQVPPLYGCVLIGGASQRMGQAKHLLPHATGKTWLEHALAVLSTHCRIVVIGGEGALPPALPPCMQLPDIPGVPGPLSGLLAAMRWAPAAAWIFCACDMPAFSPAAMAWLLAQRKPGIHALLPRLPGSRGVEPLGAYYAPSSRNLLEAMAARGVCRLHALIGHEGVATPRVPASLKHAWRNINSKQEWNDPAA